MDYRTIIETETKKTTDLIDLGLVDDKNRKIGIEVTLHEETYRALSDEEAEKNKAENYGYGHWYTSVAPGHYFVAYAMVTRDGKTFGASQFEKRFVTEAERIAYVAKRIATARVRYSKIGKRSGPPSHGAN